MTESFDYYGLTRDRNNENWFFMLNQTKIERLWTTLVNVSNVAHKSFKCRTLVIHDTREIRVTVMSVDKRVSESLDQ